MKKNLFKRAISLFFVFVMILSVVPTGVISAQGATNKTFYQYRSSDKKMFKDSCVHIYPTNNNKVGKITIREGFKLNTEGGFKNLYGYKTLYYRFNKPMTRMYIDENEKLAKSGACLLLATVHYQGEAKIRNITKIDSFKYRTTTNYGSFFDDNYSFSNSYEWGDRVYFKDEKSTSSNAITALSSNSNKTGARKTINITTAYNAPASGNVVMQIPANVDLVATEVSNGYGKVKYNGVTCWINLNYVKYLGPVITKPEPPTVKIETSSDIPATGLITVSWNSVYDAKYYKACLYNSAGQEVKSYGDLYGTTASFTPQDEGVYTVKVYAQNSMYTSDPGVLSQAITVHGKSKVTYLNWDDTVLGTQDVSYKNASTAPIAPEREGYTFYGWSDTIDNITSQKTVKAVYTINKYPVMFFDKSGKQIGDTQYVEYQKSAVAPEAPEINGYVFSGWSSDDWKNVYRENKSDPIKIYPIYVWENQEIPVTCNITEASRQPDGYYVKFNIENHVNKITRGRAVVCLKTASGKLVYTTESSAFSIPANSSENGIKVFVPCDSAASKAEVIILDSFEKSIPISQTVSSNIDQGKMWSEWEIYDPSNEASVDARAAENGWEIVKEDIYRYKTRSTTTGNTPTKLGWTQYGTPTSYTTAPSSWTDSIIDEINYPGQLIRKVEPRQVDVWASRTKYDYFHYKNWSTGRWSPVLYSGFDSNKHTASTTYSLTWRGNSSVAGWSFYGYVACGACGADHMWYPEGTHEESYVSGQKTQYRYTDTTYTYYFEKWSDYSDWTTDSVVANTNRQVDHKKRFRYKEIAASIEDDSGEFYTVEGTLDPSLSGKLINLYVTKYGANSDFTNEYVGQSTIKNDGSYSFRFKLREQPSEKTGDLTAYIGIQGTEEMQAVKVFEAPKAIYTVKYYDDVESTNVISEQFVEEGDCAVIPSTNPEKEGYVFAGWNNTCTNVKSDMEVRPIFVKKQLIVNFVDPRNEENNTEKTYEYGEALMTEELTVWDKDNVPSGYANGWDVTVANDADHANTETTVTENTVVYKQYETRQFDVTFEGVNGEILDNVEVEYDGYVEMPELPEQEGVEFLGWDVDEDALMEVKDSVTVNAIYVFNDTTATPQISLETGAYEGTQTATISCATDNAVIWYTLDGSDPSENPDALEYTGPITISDSCVLTCYAGSINANDSEIVQESYVIDGNGKIVTIKNYQNSDEDLILLVDEVEDINVEDITEYGYVFDGFYYDNDFTQPANVKTDDFRETVTLYAKFTPETYTVTFKDNNGNTVQTTTADYASSVTPPEMSDIGDLVFLGWDGGDYEFVSEDLTLTAIYKHKDEIVNIELNRYNYSLEEGFSFKLQATVTPAEKSDLMVIWMSEDDSIASVLDDGTVTANKAGETKIYAITQDDSAVAECKVTVRKSPNLSLCFKETAIIGLDSQGNVRGIPLDNNTVEFVSSQLRNTDSSLKFVKADGTVLTGTQKVGTGTRIMLMDGNRVLDSLTIVLTGDINRDGEVNVPDVSLLAQAAVNKVELDEQQTLAADVNGSGGYNNRDAAYLLQYLVGKKQINTAV